jgi:alpha-ketoglutarate-dependent 2,4-dichlorophenoxyacetate dioxygenase
MTIAVRQLHPLFVAEVTGADLSRPTPDLVQQVTAAIDRYAVLVFRGQKLDDDQLLALGQAFGPLSAPRLSRAQRRLGHAAVADISNLDSDGRVRDPSDHKRLDALGNQLWHSDASFRQVAGGYSMLHAHVIPPQGGETEFADLRAAWDALDAGLQARIEPLVAEHSIFTSRGALGHTDYTAEERAALPPAFHRIVRVHPGSKRRSLYMGAHAGAVVGMPVPVGKLLLRDLMEHATERRFVHRHAWTVGDLVMWGNRCTLHRGRPYDDTRYPRDLRRVTTQDPETMVAAAPAAAE